MSKVRFLCDEAMAVFLADAVLQREPAIAIGCVGGEGLPPKSTSDPDLLLFAEEQQYCLLTFDRNTMASHVAANLAAGRHTWGVFNVRNGFSIRLTVDNLILIWSASPAEDWIDYMDWLPW